MFQRTIAAALCIALAGCQTVTWTKPGTTPQDFTTDAYQCERDARMSGYFGGGLIGIVEFTEFQERCMFARGWMKTIGSAAENAVLADQALPGCAGLTGNDYVECYNRAAMR